VAPWEQAAGWPKLEKKITTGHYDTEIVTNIPPFTAVVPRPRRAA
jgi:hypothetical protein